MMLTRREAIAAFVVGAAGSPQPAGRPRSSKQVGHEGGIDLSRSVLTPARRAELLAALRGNADDPLARDAAVRQEDFEPPVTSAPCAPLTWNELTALLEQDGRN